MKRVIIFVVICFVTLSIGLTSYFILNDRESIYVLDVRLDVNAGEEFEIEIEHLYPRSSTTIDFESRQKDVVHWNPVTGQMNAKDTGGRAIIEVRARDKIIDTVIVSVGNGTKQFPYYIRDEDELARIGKDQSNETVAFELSDNYILLNHLDLSRYNSGIWEPIGHITQDSFMGEFNFNNKTIRNMEILSSETSSVNAGLFYSIGETAKVSRLKLDNVYIEGDFDYAGVITGVNNGRIQLVEIENSLIRVSGANSVIGTVAGINETISKNNRASIDKVAVYKSNTIEEPISKAAGIAGINEGGTILNSFSRTVFDVSDTYSPRIGGIVAENIYAQIPEDTSIETANIRDVYYAGIFDLENPAGQSNIGIIMYENTDYGSDENRVAGIYYLEGYSAEIPEVVVLEGGSMPSALDGRINSLSTSGFMSQKPYLSFTDYNTNEIYWNFSTVWKIDEVINDGLPTINMETNPVNGLFHLMAIEGEITNEVQLRNISNDLSGNYTLKANIDLTGSPWIPIGNETTPFTGTFVGSSDGDYVISGIEIDNDYKNNGFFGVISGSQASVSNITLSNVDVDGGANVGGLVGKVVNGATIKNIKVLGGTITSELNSNREYGAETVSSLNLGGVIGIAQSGSTIEDIVSSNNVVGVSRADYTLNVGGVIGQNNTQITDLYSASTINVVGANKNYAGGIVGLAEGINTFTKRVKFAGEFITSASNEGGYTGGIIGKLSSSSVLEVAHVTGDGVVSGYKSGGIVGLSSGTVDMVHMQGSVKGHLIGGIAYRIVEGTISNAMAQGSLEGISRDSESSGFAHYIEYRNEDVAAKLKNSFSMMNFSGTGTNFAETTAPVRTEYWRGARAAGYIEDSLYYDQGLDLVSQDFRVLGINMEFPLSWFDIDPEVTITEEEATGQVGDFVIFNNLGFNTQKWNLTVGGYPSLIAADNLESMDDLIVPMD